MGSATARRSIRDAVARSDKPAATFGNGVTMTVVNGTVVKIPHIQAPAPCPVGCTITSTKLRLTQQGTASTGNRTLSLYRITGKWTESTLTWKGRPPQDATPVATVTVNGAGSDGRVVEFDLPDVYQSFVDGEFVNWGFTLESNNGNDITFYTSESIKNKPELVTAWSNRPETPTDLFPSGGALVSTPKPLLRWKFIDLGGNTTLGAIQVQIKGSSAGWSAKTGFTSPTFDSGVTAAGKPQYALGSSGYAGIASGGSMWWTVRHRDGAGLWSDWADPQQVTYSALPVPTLNSPGPTVNDTTFPWSWSVSAQVRYQLLILDGNGKQLWDSKELTSADARSFTQPRGVIKKSGSDYTAVLRVWDSTSRQSINGAPAYAEVRRTFTYVDLAGVAPVTDLELAISDDLSEATFTWARSAMPDQFTVWLGDEQHAVLNGPDVFLTGTTYQATFYDIPPRLTHTVTIKAVEVDGSDVSKSSKNNPTVDVYLDPVGVRLVDTGTGDAVILYAEDGQDDIVTSEMPEISERFEPIGADVAVNVTSVLRWFEGTIDNGILADLDTVSAREQRARMLAMKATPLVPKVLVWGRNAVPIYLSKVNVVDENPAVGERYKVSAAFAAAVPSPEWELS